MKFSAAQEAAYKHALELSRAKHRQMRDAAAAAKYAGEWAQDPASASVEMQPVPQELLDNLQTEEERKAAVAGWLDGNELSSLAHPHGHFRGLIESD
jgi:hypothetical protein